MKTISLFILLFVPTLCIGQSFNWPSKQAVKLPRSVILELTKYLEKHEGYPVMPAQFTQIPTFNILHPTQKEYVEGIYFFTYNEHDTGKLFINRKGKITILADESTAGMLLTYAAFLKQNSLPEITQIAYLSAISAFLKHQYETHKALVKSGGLQELK